MPFILGDFTLANQAGIIKINAYTAFLDNT